MAARPTQGLRFRPRVQRVAAQIGMYSEYLWAADWPELPQQCSPDISVPLEVRFEGLSQVLQLFTGSDPGPARLSSRQGPRNPRTCPSMELANESCH